MAILVLTAKPARIRRLAVDGDDDLIYEADVGNIDARLADAWRMVVVDDDVSHDSISIVEAASRAGNYTVLALREVSLMQTISAYRAGAADVVALPIDGDRIRRALETHENRGQAWENAVSRTTTYEWVGSSPAMLETFRLAAQAASGMMNVLIVGESGVGKGLLARIIHEQGPRAGAPFVEVSCAAFESTALARELFGSAGSDSLAGHLARAGEGTVFLDELAALAPPLQARLAAALRERAYTPIGGFERRAFDVRLISATTRPVRGAAAGGELRQDLLYEFAIEIAIPPLRRRTEDIALLASYFLERFSARYGRSIHGFDAEALDLLEKYDWPGNVRQLRSVIERAVVACNGRAIREEHLPAELTGAHEQLKEADAGSVALEAVERRHIRQIWRITGGHLSETADLLGIHRNTLRRKLEQYGITEEDARV